MRSVAPYIHAFRNKTFVVGFGGEVVHQGLLNALVSDIAPLQAMGIEIVLVHGSRPQVEEQMSLHGVEESEPSCGRSIHAARRALGEFCVAEVLVNTASFLTENSSLRTATLTCARQCAPSSVHRICCFFAMRWLTTRFTADSAMLLLIGSPL